MYYFLYIKNFIIRLSRLIEKYIDMSKKMMILILVVTSFFVVNGFVVNRSNHTLISFENIEALAAEESGSSNKVNCIAGGTICVGINANNQMGRFPGLRYVH